MALRPVATWLTTSRLGQTMVGPDGEPQPWTQEHFLELLKAETGWAPHRPNYSGYENDHSVPSGPTLRKFVAFWATRGVTGPDLTPPKEPAPPVDLATAISAQADAIQALVGELRKWRTEDRVKLEKLAATVGLLAGRALDLPETRELAEPGAPETTAE